jgi:hypothetical protein
MFCPVKAANAVKEVICRIVMEQDPRARARAEARGAGFTARVAAKVASGEPVSARAKTSARKLGRAVRKIRGTAREKVRARGEASAAEGRPGTGALPQGPGPLG